MIKKLMASATSLLLVAAIMLSPVNGLESTTLVQNLDTNNGYGYVDQEVDQFETYSTVAKTADNYTSISSKIYKPVSGDTLIVVFHGNGEGGVNGKSNNYSQLAGNRLAVTYTTDEIQSEFGGAYVLAFQAPDEWYKDYTDQAKAIIDTACNEFGIKEVFVSGLSAGGLMTQRMLSKYGDFFSGALFSCAAIAKNDTYVEGLGGNYADSTDSLSDEDFKAYAPLDDIYTTAGTFKEPADFNDYLQNYNGWLDSIAQSNVPIFMVHCYYDTTIYYKWTEYAYHYITSYRQNHNLDGDIHLGLIDSVSYENETFSSAHWSWIKMLNGDIYTSDNSSLDTMTWFTSLSTSTNNYVKKEFTLPEAGASENQNTYKYNLIATVTNSGEKVTAIEIDMNGDAVNPNLSADMFTVTGYNEDASGLLDDSITSYGLFGSKDAPVTIEVASVSVNERGNIILNLATQNGVLNYTTTSRNLATNMYYNITVDGSLTVETTKPDENNTTPSTETKDKEITSPKTGDDSNILYLAGLMSLSAVIAVATKRKLD